MSGLGAVALAALLAVPPSGQAAAVAGAEKTVFLLTHPTALPPIPEHAAGGWRQDVDRRDARTALVTVSSEARPLGSRSPYPIEYLPEVAAPFLRLTPPEEVLSRPAERVVRGAPGSYGASARLVALAGRRVRDVRHPSPDLEQDARTAWEKGRGTCVGRANLAVSLLRNAGIPARTAHGIRLEAPAGAAREISPRLLHRWVEVFLPDRGWIPSDPAASIHHLGTSYILLSLGGERPARTDQALRGLQVQILDREGGIRPLDEADPLLGLTGRDPPILPNDGERRAGAIEVEARPGARLALKGPGGTRRARTDASGRHTFVGLDPGLYRLKDSRGSENLLMVSGTEWVRVLLP